MQSEFLSVLESLERSCGTWGQAGPLPLLAVLRSILQRTVGHQRAVGAAELQGLVVDRGVEGQRVQP